MNRESGRDENPAVDRALTRRQLLGSMAGLGAMAASGRLLGASGRGALRNTSSVARPGGRQPAAAPVKLVVWEQLTSLNAAKPAVAAFNKIYPHITIEWVPIAIANTSTKLLAALTAGSGAPDVAFIQYTDMGKFTSTGGTGLVNLKSRMTTAPYALNQWWAPALAIATTPSGEIIGLPADYGAEGTFYRRDTFKAAGLPTAPSDVLAEIKTWDDFMALGMKLKAKSGKFMINSGADIFNIARQQGVQAYFAPDGKPLVADAEFVNAAELAKQARVDSIDLNPPDLFTYLTGGTSTAVTTAFQNGDVAVTFSAAWEEIIINAEAPNTKGDWGVTLLPQNARANVGGSYYVLPTQAGHVAEAWLFASFVLASKGGMGPYLSGFKFLPVWKPAYTVPSFTAPSPYFGSQIWLPEFITLASNNPKLVVTANDTIASTAVANALVSILSDKVAPQKALKNAANQITSQVSRA